MIVFLPQSTALAPLSCLFSSSWSAPRLLLLPPWSFSFWKLFIAPFKFCQNWHCKIASLFSSAFLRFISIPFHSCLNANWWIIFAVFAFSFIRFWSYALFIFLRCLDWFLSNCFSRCFFVLHHRFLCFFFRALTLSTSFALPLLVFFCKYRLVIAELLPLPTSFGFPHSLIAASSPPPDPLHNRFHHHPHLHSSSFSFSSSTSLLLQICAVTFSRSSARLLMTNKWWCSVPPSPKTFVKVCIDLPVLAFLFFASCFPDIEFHSRVPTWFIVIRWLIDRFGLFFVWFLSGCLFVFVFFILYIVSLSQVCRPANGDLRRWWIEAHTAWIGE